MVSSKAKVQLRTRKLEAGMVLAKPVHSRDGSRLFPEGQKLGENDIQKLQNWNIRFVYVESAEEDTERAKKAS